MMLQYDRWATHELLEACRVLTADQLSASMPGVSGTVGELLTHIVGAMRTFAFRTRGRQDEGEWSRESPWPGFDALQAAASSASDDLIAIAEALEREEDVDLPFMGKRFRFPKSFFLVHAVEHGTEHRTEVKVALNQLGIHTPDLDGWAFAAASGFGREI
jgi:uncharacterized damage-inducible protein DinB